MFFFVLQLGHLWTTSKSPHIINILFPYFKPWFFFVKIPDILALAVETIHNRVTEFLSNSAENDRYN